MNILNCSLVLLSMVMKSMLDKKKRFSLMLKNEQLKSIENAAIIKKQSISLKKQTNKSRSFLMFEQMN
jgi:hypothetical protein